MKPEISIVIPLYNKESSIFRTVQSVLNQTFKDFELLIIDDGSTDNSIKIISEVKDDRLKIFSKLNGGVSDARNYGVRKALSDYIFFLDADDIISDICLSVFIGLVNKYKGESVFISNFKILLADDKEIIYSQGKKECLLDNPLKALWNKTVLPRTGAMLIKRECFEHVGNFQTNITVYEDLDFILRLLKKYKAVYTPEVLLYYQCEYNYLSQKVFPLSREFAYYINLSDTTYYERLILSDNLYHTYKIRRKTGDKEAIDYLKRKNSKYWLFIMFAIIYKKFVNLKYKIENNVN